MLKRRGFLAGVLAAGFAPAFVGSKVLMPVRALVPPALTLGLADAGRTLFFTGDEARTLSLPNSAALPIGTMIRLLNESTAPLTIDMGGASPRVEYQGAATILKVTTDRWRIAGQGIS